MADAQCRLGRSRAAKIAGLARRSAAYLSRCEWTIAFRSKSAVSNRALIITKSNWSRLRDLDAGVGHALLRSPRAVVLAAPLEAKAQLVPARRQDEDQHRVRNSRLICSAPCQSISSSTSWPPVILLLDRGARGAVEVAVHLGPFDELAALDHRRETSARRRSGTRGPCWSWPRGFRVVCEIDSDQVRIELEQRLTRVDLPDAARRGDGVEVSG